MSWFVLRWLLCVYLLVWFLPSPAALAQDVALADQADIVETPEVVVSATKTPIPVTQVTSSVEVIKGEELVQRKVKMVADALRLAQGVTMFSNGGPGTTSTARIRGAGSEQTLVLIDGAIMNSATLGSFDFANLTTDNIDRIEILRGPQSMLWGSDAMGGVINITTKRGEGKPTAGGFLEYGAYNSRREGAQVSGQKGPIDFSAALSLWDFSGFSAANYRRGAVERDPFRNWQGSTRLGVALPNEGRLDFNFRWLQSKTFTDSSFPTDVGTEVLGSRSDSQRFIYSASYYQPILSWWSQKLTLSRQTEKAFADPGTEARDLGTGFIFNPTDPQFNPLSQINTLTNRVEWQHNIQVAKPLLLVMGYQFREQQGENNNLSTGSPDISKKSITSNAGFAEGQLNMWDRVFATAGVRYDEYNVFGSATTYRVSGGYLHRETGTKFRGSYGTGFRVPTLNDLFYPNYGNPNVKPEHSQGFDAGVDQYLFSDRVTLSAVYFGNRFRDLIIPLQSASVCGVGSFGPNYCAQNLGLAESKGWEISVKASILRDLPGAKSLDFRIQYTNTMAKDLQQRPGNRLPRVPVDQWSMVVSYQPIEPVRINLEGRYVGARYDDAANSFTTPAFNVWNLSAYYDINKTVQIYTRIDNLFNEKYEEILVYGTAGLSAYGGIRFTL